MITDEVVQAHGSGPSSLPFGRRLRLERERRRITLDSIADNTKIGVALLKGLERDDVSRWPSGIFRRSFIREYAAAIGLDPDAIMLEFLERFPDKAEPPMLPPVKPPDYPMLRLTLADTDAWAVQRCAGPDRRTRWAATVWDLATCFLISSGLFLAVNQFWMPLAVTLMGYYGTSTVLLGNTPGVS